MTLGHFLYIPGVLCLGLLIGYILGGRAAEVARADADQQARRRAARQAAREANEANEANEPHEPHEPHDEPADAARGQTEGPAAGPAAALGARADKPPGA